MRALNYSERAFLIMMACSSLFTSLFWLLVMWQVTHTTRTYSIAFAWLSMTFVLMLLGLFVGSRVTRRTLWEGRLKLRLKKLRQERACSERKKNLINDNLIESVIIVDKQLRVVSANRAARRRFKVRRTKNASLAEMIREPELYELSLIAQQERRTVEQNIRIGNKTGSIFFVRVIPMQDGEIMLTALDITRMSTMDQKHNDFIAHASHELKTPISVMLANAELLLDANEQSSPEQPLLNAIMRQGLRAKNLLDSLLELLRLDAAIAPATLEIIELRLFIDDIKDSLGQYGDMIHNEVPDNILLYADYALLERLSLIIIENAQKYAGAAPSLIIQAQRSKDKIKIRFVDSGPGIKQHLREKVFERFYRQPEHEASDREGFGLGLPRARAIALSMGGKISVDDTLTGCAIALYLKAANEDPYEQGLPVEYFDGREI